MPLGSDGDHSTRRTSNPAAGGSSPAPRDAPVLVPGAGPFVVGGEGQGRLAAEAPPRSLIRWARARSEAAASKGAGSPTQGCLEAAPTPLQTHCTGRRLRPKRKVSRMLRRLGLLVVLALTVSAVAAAPGANAAPKPTGTLAEAPSPRHPAEPPKADESAVKRLRGHLSGRNVTLTLACRDSGRLELSVLGHRAKRLGASRFTCEQGRARVTLTVPRRAARRARTRRGVKLIATIRAGGKRSQFTLQATARRHGSRSVRAATLHDPLAWCTGVGFTLAVNNTMRFSANYGEQVWWRPIGYEYRESTRTYSWNMRSGWDTYRAVPGDGYFLYDSTTGTFEFTWTVAHSLPLYTTTYGVWVRPAIQVYTQRGGYQSMWVTASVIRGYEQVPTDWCYTRSL
jgi:hypothetical protein